jgi:Domain of unknown function (DUF4269)
VLELLAPFGPRVAGTPPLGLELPDSDIDVLCFAPDPHRFIDTVWRAFSDTPAFTAKQWVDPPRPVIASFEVAGWRIELYGKATPVERQRVGGTSRLSGDCSRLADGISGRRCWPCGGRA